MAQTRIAVQNENQKLVALPTLQRPITAVDQAASVNLGTA
jgi:hypothetical protein